MIFQPVDPFPDPTHAGQEIELIGLMFGAILIMLLLILFMIYFYVKIKHLLPIIITFLFSVIFSLSSFQYGIPFTPYLQIFLMLIQTSFLLLATLATYKENKGVFL